MARKGYDRGTTFNYPLRVKDKLTGQTTEQSDMVLNQAPSLRCDLLYDFLQEVETYTVPVPLYDVTNENNTILVGANSRARYKVHRAGKLIAAHLTAEDGLATDTTNHLTFTLTNELASGSGTVEMLDITTGANTTDSDNASAVAITAKTGRALALSVVANALNVAEGDHLLFTATVGGTLANAVDLPVVWLTFSTIGRGIKPTISRIAGSPTLAPVDDTRSGEVLMQFTSTNEAQTLRLDFNDQLCIPATAEPIFEARVKIADSAANVRTVIGLVSAFNATLDSAVSNAWFRTEGADQSLFIEVDDGTTDTDDFDTGADFTDATYHVLRVDFAQGTGAIRFFVDGNLVATKAGSAFAVTDVLQPIIALQKASGTSVISVTVDYIRVSWNRF